MEIGRFQNNYLANINKIGFIDIVELEIHLLIGTFFYENQLSN